MEEYKTLQLFMTRIQKTVSTSVLTLTIYCKTAYDMLVKLKTRFRRPHGAKTSNPGHTTGRGYIMTRRSSSYQMSPSDELL